MSTETEYIVHDGSEFHTFYMLDDIVDFIYQNGITEITADDNNIDLTEAMEISNLLDDTVVFNW
jgi:hypothetical protein